MRISVVGLGKLGLPMAGILARAGHQVIGVDKNEGFVAKINEGISPINETGLQALLREVDLPATSDVAAAIYQTDITFVVVPTPSLPNDNFSNEYVVAALEEIGAALKNKAHSEHTVVVTSTVMPGACSATLIPCLEQAAGRRVGELLNFAYSPEFIALGSVIADMYRPDFVLIGEPEGELRAGNVLSHIYRSYLTDSNTQICRCSVIDAEIAKLSLNCYLTVKISFANMISEFCERVPGADAAIVCRIVGHDSRVGSKYLRPGTAAAGPCLPRDLRAMSASLYRHDVTGELIDAAISVNDRQVSLLKAKAMSFRPKKVAVLGMAYKPGTSVTDASVGRGLVDQLRYAGVKTDWYDPLVTGGANTPEDALLEADVVAITTPDPAWGLVNYGDRTVLDCWDVAYQGTNILRQGQNPQKKDIWDVYR